MPKPGIEHGNGFTLVELLVTMAVLSLLLVLLLGITNQTTQIWQRTSSTIEEFREARNGYESLSRRLSQATLNTYWDYDNPSSPTKYIRQSELRFISGYGVAGSEISTPRRPTHSIFFQAPLGYVAGNTSYTGLEKLLNTWGYYIEFNSDSVVTTRPSFITSAITPLRYRFRLMEMMEPSDKLTLYNYSSGRDASQNIKNLSYVTGSVLPGTTSSGTTPLSGQTGWEWFTTPLASTTPQYSHVLAENIIALVLLPRLSTEEDSTGAALSPKYNYDSTCVNANSSLDPKNQLPPVVQLVMVAIDERSARRLQGSSVTMPDLKIGSASPPLFTDATKLQADIAALEATLINNHITYRIFSSNIIIKGAKWSRAQTN